MLKRIAVRGYKSLQNVEIELGSLNVLVGPNAAGKSNFLDLLQLISRLVTARTLKEAFESPYRGSVLESFTFGPRGIEGLLEEEQARFSVEADIELSPAIVDKVNRLVREMKRKPPNSEQGDGGQDRGLRNPGKENGGGEPSLVRERSLRYKIELEVIPRTGVLRVADEYLTALNSRGEPTKKRQPFLELMDRDRFHLRMEGQAHPKYFERGLDHAILSLPHYPPHHPHLVALREELASWSLFYLEPRQRMRVPNSVKEVRHIGLMGEDLAAFLNTLKALAPSQFDAINKALTMIIPSASRIDVEINPLGQVELRLIDNGVPIPGSLLSEGTLRVLGILALTGVKEPSALIGFEEPENGVHPRRLGLIADLFENIASSGETQVILTTHSPSLADRMPEDSLVLCRKERGKTLLTKYEAGPLFQGSEVRRVLDGEETMPFSQRMMRGDFDA